MQPTATIRWTWTRTTIRFPSCSGSRKPRRPQSRCSSTKTLPIFPHGVEDLALFPRSRSGHGRLLDRKLGGDPAGDQRHENQAGTVQFAWVDDKFLVPGKGNRTWRSGHAQIRFTDSVYKLPGRGIIGENAWGTVDGWRRPRPVYWLSKKLYSPGPNRGKAAGFAEGGRADRRARGELESIYRPQSSTSAAGRSPASKARPAPRPRR